MEKFKDISQLTEDCTITLIKGGQVQNWKFLMIYPHNDSYILAINASTENADKLFIPNLFEDGYYVGIYDSAFVLNERIKQYEKEIEYLKMLLKRKTGWK